MKSVEEFAADLQRGVELAFADETEWPEGADVFSLAQRAAEAEERLAASRQRLGPCVPRVCIFSVTWRCNLDCVGCYASNYRTGRELTLDEVEQTIRHLCEMGTWIFVIAGGEPLLLDGLLDRLAGVEDAFFILFTNGTLLGAPEAKTIARAGNVLPVLSVDGPADATDARRGAGTWGALQQALAHLRDVHMPFAFASMVTRPNLDAITSRAWFDTMWDAGARFAFLIDYQPFEHNLQPDLVLTGDDMTRKQALVAQRHAEARPLVLNFPADEYAGGTCHAAGVGMIHVNADGYVEACPYSHYAADNVRDKPIEQILTADFLARIREKVLPLPNPHGQCQLFLHANCVQEIAAQTGGFATEQP